MSAKVESAYVKATYVVENSEKLATQLHWQWVLKQVSLVVLDILCTGVGVAATLYSSRHKPHYTLLTGGGCCLVLLYLLKFEWTWYGEEAKKVYLQITTLNEYFEIFTKLKQNQPNIEPIKAINGFFAKRCERAYADYENTSLSPEERLKALKSYFRNKTYSAYVFALSECQKFKEQALESWVTQHTDSVTIPLKDCPYLSLGNFSISCKEMETFGIERIEEMMLAVMRTTVVA